MSEPDHTEAKKLAETFTENSDGRKLAGAAVHNLAAAYLDLLGASLARDGALEAALSEVLDESNWPLDEEWCERVRRTLIRGMEK